MKIMLISLTLAGLLMGGCGRIEAAADAVEDRLDSVGDTIESRMDDMMSRENGAITEAEAKAIALKHAGFTEDQVTYLRADYEIDDGVPQYEVSFHQNGREYDYEINAEDGTVISFDKED